MSDDCKSFKRNDLRRCGIKIGSRLCTKPQKKNKLVTSINGKSQLLVGLLMELLFDGVAGNAIVVILLLLNAVI
jgi:hypothetical protein